ncbi:hypothetical protein JHK87_005321 [Glycine soja]|nr:hypothetical protein JHK87_005321 [Glycine soja]
MQHMRYQRRDLQMSTSFTFTCITVFFFFLLSFDNYAKGDLIPSPTCKRTSIQGLNRKVSLDLVHIDGPCSHLKRDNVSIDNDLFRDHERVKYIQSRISKNNSSYQLDSSVSIPTIPGIPLGTLNYYIVIRLGTPENNYQLQFDTGSDLTWTQCEQCTTCYEQSGPRFYPAKSTTYVASNCFDETCKVLIKNEHGLDCSKDVHLCHYRIYYGDGSLTRGYFGKDRLALYNDLAPNPGITDNFYFGCGIINDGTFGRTSGIFGLGRGELSFLSQTSKQYMETFSYCIPSVDDVGYITFGYDPDTDFDKRIKYTPLVIPQGGLNHYGLSITGIAIDGDILPGLNFSQINHAGFIIDSGTVFTRLPPTIYATLRSVFQQRLSNYPTAPSHNVFDTCYDLTGYHYPIPEMSFVFPGVTVDLHPPGVLYEFDDKQSCLAFIPNKDDSQITIFGNVQQKTLEIVYDNPGNRIGFRSDGCS